MFLEAMPREALTAIITGLFTIPALYVTWFTTIRKNKNDREIKDKELKAASWVPLVQEMKAFAKEQRDHLQGEIDDLRLEMQVNNAYKHDVASQIQILRVWSRDRNLTDVIPKVDTYDEWYVRYYNSKG